MNSDYFVNPCPLLLHDMSDGYGELIIFDLNSPILSKLEACVLHDVRFYDSPCSMPEFSAGQSNSMEIRDASQSEQLDANKDEGSLQGLTCAIDMPAALETALDDVNFLVCGIFRLLNQFCSVSD
jgi:hypothetical protein